MDFLGIDRALFYWINGSWANPVLDVVMPFITAEESWFLPGMLVVIWLLWKGKRKGRLAVLVLAVAISISDQMSSSLLKPVFRRERPCRVLPEVRLLDRCGKSYSFPSSHATNSFTAAALFSRFYPGGRWIYFAVAGLVALSRPYVGVHYPSDVAAGALLGWAIGWVVWFLLRQLGHYLPVLESILGEEETVTETETQPGKREESDRR
jgi:undecaprenyl-diphosphatase